MIRLQPLTRRTIFVEAAVQKFHHLRRDQIEQMCFADLKNPTTAANATLKRMTRDGILKADRKMRMYRYSISRSEAKNDGSMISGGKADHFIAIADFYLELCKAEKPTRFDVEPKVGNKGMVEPDVFVSWKGKAYFVELQRTRISKKAWKEKLDGYERLRYSREWKNFPTVWMIGQKVEYDGELEIINSWGDTKI